MSIMSHPEATSIHPSWNGHRLDPRLRLEAARGQYVGAEARAADPWKQLVAEIIRRAIRDLQAGRPCRPDRCDTDEPLSAHVCVSDARRFLTSSYCDALFTYLGIDAQAAREELGLRPSSSPGGSLPLIEEKQAR
ncbi:MAG: hypothetical protein ACOC7Y_03055 [Chloroflexota bacterium]